MTEEKAAPASGSILVVGGGISGLTTAMWIQSQQLEAQLQRTDDERAKVRRISSLMVELAARLSEYDRAAHRCEIEQRGRGHISLPEQLEIAER